MGVDKEKQLGSDKPPTSQEKALRESSQGWVAYPKGKTQIPDGNGGKITLDLEEWYRKLDIPNRAGT